MSELSDAAYERVEDARIILETLGMDPERSNERSALVLLALLRLTPAESWAEAANPMLGTRAIMDFIRDEYGKDYAPNSRDRPTVHTPPVRGSTTRRTEPRRAATPRELTQVELPGHR